jgi:UPF0755 protein
VSRRLVIVVVTIVVVLVVAVVTAGGWLHWALLRAQPVAAVRLEVKQGTAQAAVLERLHREGLLPSPLAGRIYLLLQARGRTLHYGHYRLPANSRPIDALERILDGRVETLTVTIVEGFSADTVGERMEAAGIGTRSDWYALVNRTDWIRHLAPDAPSLEGFLFPDTYRFAIGTSPQHAARHLVDRFIEVWQAESSAVGTPWGSILEVVTLASLVEAETALPEERTRIAGVFLNRLRRGMLLQCDPTVVFALKRRREWQGRLLREHWQVDDPYNTYRYPGLPPGPINSPGRAALAAALSPEQHRYLYFVAKPGGGHTFSRTLVEHNRAVARLQHSRR